MTETRTSKAKTGWLWMLTAAGVAVGAAFAYRRFRPGHDESVAELIDLAENAAKALDERMNPDYAIAG